MWQGRGAVFWLGMTMRKPLLIPLLLAAILLSAGSGETVRATDDGSVGQQGAASTGFAAGRARQSAAVVPMADCVTGSRGAGMPRTSLPGPGLTADDAALVAEVSALQLLAHGLSLDLSSAEWTALAEVSRDIQAIRQNYEAQIATGVKVAPGRFRVEIPMYAGAGDAIRTRFVVQMRSELGAATADEIVAKLGARLEGYFGGFGVAVQTLDISGDPRAPRNDCEVTRTVKYWNSVEGSDRLTIRRETHFPAWEDPRGENWGPLLAVVGA